MKVISNMFRALRHRNFALFCGGQAISLVGSWMQSMALAWLIFRLTGSATQLGAVTFCAQIPILIFSSLGGIIADRYPKRTVLLCTQISYMLIACILALLTLTDYIQVWHIYLTSILSGLTTAVDMPARQSYIINMVDGKEDLSNAIVINSSMVNGARLLGPSIAGVLVAWIGEGYCFLLNGISYLAVFASLINITVAGFSPDPDQGGVKERIAGGYHFAAQNQPISSLLLVVATMSLNSSAHTVLMPVFASDVLHGNAETMGFLLAIEGVGAMIGALLLACKRTTKNLEYIIAAASVCCGILLVLFSLTTQKWMSALCLVPLGMTIVGQLSTSNTLIQYLTPDHLRGRVMGLHGMMFLGLNPVGALAYGTLADHIGAPTTLAVSGIILLLGSLRFVFTMRTFQTNAERLAILTEQCNRDLASKEKQ